MLAGGPFPLGYIGLGSVSIGYCGLGDVFVLAYFGYVATIAPYFIRRPWPVFKATPPFELMLAATSLGFLATAVLVVNNLRDRKTDVLVNKRTLAVRFGETFSRCEYVVLVLGAYGLLVGAAVLCYVPPSWLLAFASFPLAVSMLRHGNSPKLVVQPCLYCQVTQLRSVLKKDGGALNPHVGGTAK